MSLRKIVGMQGGVEDFQFQIVPKSISLPKHIKSFIVYLQKGMQILGRFESDQNLIIKQSFYRFRQAEPAIFHVSNLLHCNYTWSLYSISLQTNQEILEDSTSFNIERTVKLYQIELMQKQRQIQTSIKQKNVNKPMILTLWDKIKKDMKAYKSKQTCLFSNQNYQIQFQIQIKNILDFEVKRANQQQQRRLSMKRNKSNESSLNSSPSPSSIKTKLSNHESKTVIQLDTSPYLFSSKQIKEAISTNNSIQTKENTQTEDFNATVKIMNPKGEQIHTQNQDYVIELQGEETNNNNNDYSQFKPLKKFSLLSDIIQQSYQGSSSYGHYDRSSSNDVKLYPNKNEGNIDMVIQRQLPPMQLSPFNKVRTLPHQSHHHHRSLQVKERFRRAQTSEKKPNQQSSQIQEESVISISNIEETPKEPEKDTIFTKGIMKKAIIIAIIVFISLFIFLSLQGDKDKRRKIRK